MFIDELDISYHIQLHSSQIYITLDISRAFIQQLTTLL